MKQQTTKPAYRLRNWPQYNRSLVARGSLALWISPDVERTWLARPDAIPGRPNVYGESAIAAVAIVRIVLNLPLRAACGFVASFFERARIALPVPDAAAVCRRLPRLSVDLWAVPRTGAVDLVIDSTGIKVYGEGEWKVRKHDVGKRRTRRKLHLAVDAETLQTLGVDVAGNDVNDCLSFEELLAQIDGPIASISADGAYDTEWRRYLTHERKAKPRIPPRENARPRDETGGGIQERNAAIARIAEVGRKAWKVESGYHVRSLAETQMFRVKTIFGDRLRSRRPASQERELRLRMRALNVMTTMGMPESCLTERAA